MSHTERANYPTDLTDEQFVCPNGHIDVEPTPRA
jgi:hypothetical protein